MRVLIACDKFKDSLSAAQACEIIAGSIQHRHPAATIETCPITDGGEGFTEVLTRSANGDTRPQQARGPRGDDVAATFGVVSAAGLPRAICSRLKVASADRVAIVAMADASGLTLLPFDARDVWQTDTFGTGELLRAAAGTGVSAIVLGIGGSATNDLGLGALTALGLAARDSHGREVAAAPGQWAALTRFDGTVGPLPPIYIACDVTNPLLGPSGATAVYGPQKGLALGDVAKLDHAAARVAMLLCSHFAKPDTLMDEPGAGAAGGLGFGLRVAANAQLVSGFDFVCDWLDLDRRIGAADVVITGEGRFDESSLSGKGPAGVVGRALRAGKIAHVFAGAVTGAAPAADRFFAHAITPPGTPLEQALREATQNLAMTVERVFQ